MRLKTKTASLHSKTELWGLGAVLLLALVHGLIYVFVLPPWQHYDEPNHFEYAWLIAEQGKLPQPGDYDQGMRRAVLQSMISHDFFRGMSYVPDLEATDKPLWIGSYSQLGDPPLYYLLAALPLRLLPLEDVTQQLYAMRLVSWLLYLLSIAAVWGATREITEPNNPLRWMVPVTLALWPGYVDLMTAVNNDAAAVAIFSLFLWGGVRLIRRGISWLSILWTVVTAGLCLLIKQNVMVAGPLLIVALLFAGFKRWRWLAWSVLGLGMLVGLVAVFSWGDAATWFPHTYQAAYTRAVNPDAPLGNAAFQVVLSADHPDLVQLVQLIPPETIYPLRGKTVTLGAWVWAEQVARLRSATLHVYEVNEDYFQQWDITPKPTFYAFTITLPVNASRAWVTLPVQTIQGNPQNVVFYDGVVLAEGTYSPSEPPVFDSPEGASGTWGGAPFINLLRNPSAEASGLRFRSWVTALTERFFRNYERPQLVLYSLFDWSATHWYYEVIGSNLLRTFWGKFAWGHVPLLGHKPYRPLLGLTLISLAGALFLVVWKRRTLCWEELTWLGLCFASVVILAVMRGVFYMIYPPFYSGARYIFPVILPILLFLCGGWWTIGRGLERWLQIPPWLLTTLYGLLFLGLDVYALISIIHFYTA